jgi:hypothetical protein
VDNSNIDYIDLTGLTPAEIERVRRDGTEAMRRTAARLREAQERWQRLKTGLAMPRPSTAEDREAHQ